MPVPWVNGTVEAVLTDLRETYQTSTSTGAVYAAAVGMIASLSAESDTRSDAQRLADVRTVCTAVRRFEDEEPEL